MKPYSAKSKIVMANATERDITARRRGEEALLKQAEELRARNDELNRFNRAGVGRELRMVELKQQVNELCRQMDKPLIYPLDFPNAASQPSAAVETVRPEGESET